MTSIDQLRNNNRLSDTAPDIGKARGLLKRSRQRIQNLKDRDITPENAFLILENAYEAIREVIEAGMARNGISSDDHVATITWADKHLNLRTKTTNKLHRFRKLRNASRYEAKQITPDQASDIRQFATTFINDTAQNIEESLQQ